MDGVGMSERQDGALLRFVVLAASALVALFAVGAPVASAAPPAAAGAMTQMFGDEFNAPSLDTSVWTPGWLSDAAITGPMTDRCVAKGNVTQANDVLHLKLTLPNSACGSTTATETGALVESSPNDGVAGHSGFSYMYGYVEWRAQLPAGNAACPTTSCVAATPQLWSMPSEHDFEIDTAEGNGGTACFNTHGYNVDPGTVTFPPVAPAGCATASPLSLVTAFHTYGALWTPDGVAFYYDGQLVGPGRAGVHSTPHSQFLVMDLINYTGQAMVGEKDLQLDYVRLWQADGDGDHVPDGPARNSANGPDRCPGAAGPASLQGCPDADGDSVPDVDDRCPNAAGPKALDGCPDADGDAVPDVDDRCPTVKGYKWVDGCPSKPAIVVEPNGHEHVYFTGTDKQLQGWDYDGTSWSKQGWGYPGAVKGNPTATIDGDGYVNVFYRTADDKLGRWIIRSSTNWTQNDYGTGGVGGDPTAATASDGSVDVFYRTTQGEMGRWWFKGDDWSPSTLGYTNKVIGRPSVTTGPNQQLFTFYANPDRQLWLWWVQDPNWNNTGWGYTGRIASDTTTTRLTAGAFNAFFRTPEGQLGRWTIEGSNYNEGGYGAQGDVTGSPSAVLQGGNASDVYYRASNGQLGLWWIRGNDWNNTKWGSAGAIPAATDPSAAARPQGGDVIAYQNADGTLGHWWIQDSANWHFSTP
jgi:hypothetical protein